MDLVKKENINKLFFFLKNIFEIYLKKYILYNI